MYSRGFHITNEDNIREITTFVKHVTTAGNVRYAADVGHDDTVMTVVNATSIFGKSEFKEMVEEWGNKFSPKEFMSYVNDCMKNMDYVQGVDYGQVLSIRRQMMNKPKASNQNSNVGGINWFNSRS
jgi:hypothetical protein